MNTALYNHVMVLICSAYYRLCKKQSVEQSNSDDESAEEAEDDLPQRLGPHSDQTTATQVTSYHVVKDKTQKMHVWLVARALRSSYLPGKDIVEIMAERVERLQDPSVHVMV